MNSCNSKTEIILRGQVCPALLFHFVFEWPDKNSRGQAMFVYLNQVNISGNLFQDKSL
jgi:hypothetical protein